MDIEGVANRHVFDSLGNNNYKNYSNNFNNPNSNHNRNRNRKVCKFWREGRCNRNPCPFLVAELPHSSSTTSSSNGSAIVGKRSYGSGVGGHDGGFSTIKNPNFNNTWGRNHVNGGGLLRKKMEKVCNYWVQGNCTYGGRCVADDNGEGKMNLSSKVDVGDDFLELKSIPEEVNVNTSNQKKQIEDVALDKGVFDRDRSIVAAPVAGKDNAESVEDVVMAQDTPSSAITGMKRKAETAARACDEVAAQGINKKSRTLFCSLCDISATSEVTLNTHFQGKKHRAKEAKLEANDTARTISMGRCSTDTAEQAVETARSMRSEQDKNLHINKWGCSLCQLSSEILLTSHLQGKKHKAKEAKLWISKDTSNMEALTSAEPQEVAGLLSTAEAADMKWYYSLCGVTASSENNLNDHLNGKKHRAKTEQPQLGVDGKNHESGEMVTVSELVKETSLSGEGSLQDDLETRSPSIVDSDKQLVWDLINKSSVQLAVEPIMVPLNQNTGSTLQAIYDSGDMKSCQTRKISQKLVFKHAKLRKALWNKVIRECNSSNTGAAQRAAEGHMMKLQWLLTGIVTSK